MSHFGTRNGSVITSKKQVENQRDSNDAGELYTINTDTKSVKQPKNGHYFRQENKGLQMTSRSRLTFRDVAHDQEADFRHGLLGRVVPVFEDRVCIAESGAVYRARSRQPNSYSTHLDTVPTSSPFLYQIARLVSPPANTTSHIRAVVE